MSDLLPLCGVGVLFIFLMVVFLYALAQVSNSSDRHLDEENAEEQ